MRCRSPCDSHRTHGFQDRFRGRSDYFGLTFSIAFEANPISDTSFRVSDPLSLLNKEFTK
nr:MAG TPA: hypothetical protein [Caudoviricetes sp.]